MDGRKIKLALAQLEGLQTGTSSVDTLNEAVGLQFNGILAALGKIDGVDIDALKMDRSNFYGGTSGTEFCEPSDIRAKLGQAIGLLRALDSEDRVPQVVTMFDALKDTILRDRCHDLLTAKDHFDRPISQATLVLEDRLRNRSGDKGGRVGIDLLHAIANPSPDKSGLLFADDPSVHQGMFRSLEGVFLAFRNPTHHKLINSFTRERAVQVCGFIDTLLSVVDQAEVREHLIKPSRA